MVPSRDDPGPPLRNAQRTRQTCPGSPDAHDATTAAVPLPVASPGSERHSPDAGFTIWDPPPAALIRHC